VGVGLDSDLEGLTMEDQERMAVLNNNLSSSVRMVERRGRGQEGIYRAGMRVSIDTDMSSSLGLQTLYCDLRPCEHDPLRFSFIVYSLFTRYTQVFRVKEVSWARLLTALIFHLSGVDAGQYSINAAAPSEAYLAYQTVPLH